MRVFAVAWLSWFAGGDGGRGCSGCGRDGILRKGSSDLFRRQGNTDDKRKGLLSHVNKEPINSGNTLQVSHATKKLDWNELHSQAQRGGEKDWFQPFAHALNCGEISTLLHTIDILSYTYDAQYCYMYMLHCLQIYYSSMQCIKNSIDYSIRGGFESIRGKWKGSWWTRRGYLTTKSSQEVTWGSIALLSALFAGDLH